MNKEKNLRFFNPSPFPKSRKGFLLGEETLKMVIAVICIAGLAYLLFAVYVSVKDSKDLEIAKESLDFLSQEIEDEKTSVEIYNPRGWVILSWPYQNEGKLPKFCLNAGWGSCICIVKDANQLISSLPFTDSLRENLLENSDSSGVCLNTEKNFQVEDGSIEIKNPPVTLNIDYTNKKISRT